MMVFAAQVLMGSCGNVVLFYWMVYAPNAAYPHEIALCCVIVSFVSIVRRGVCKSVLYPYQPSSGISSSRAANLSNSLLNDAHQNNHHQITTNRSSDLQSNIRTGA